MTKQQAISPIGLIRLISLISLIGNKLFVEDR